MQAFDFDLLVIGAGSGGVRAARMAAQRGVRVAIVEAQGLEGLGGTCVNVGCIPKKLYAYAADYAHAHQEAAGYGWEGVTPHLNWETLKRQRAAEIQRLNGVYANLLRGAGVTLLEGHAQLRDAHHVRIATLNLDGSAGHENHSAARILIATGGAPYVPHFPGHEHVITSNEVFDLPTFPKRLLVVGGGYIACELASIFTGLGAQVVQVHRGEQILRGFDQEIRHFAAQEMKKSGLDLRVQSGVSQVSREPDGLHVTFMDGSQLVSDVVLYATGRQPNVDGLGLAAVGIQQSPQGAIVVNDNYQTSVPSVYALGDVTANVQLTPVALGEAMHLVDHLYGAATNKPLRHMDYQLIPTAVFTHPNIATVGLTEEAAKATYAQVKVYRSEFRALRHTLSGSTERTLMKLVVDAASDRVVGLHMVGAEAGEIVQGFAVAMKAGATKAVFDATLGIHPTAAEEFVTMREPVV